MDTTSIKTRYGLILQGCIAYCLRKGRFSFRENWQYSPYFERPDFTLPDSDRPRFVIEVHQTEAYNSFQMKVLRALSAVSEMKAFFGKSAMSVNILFGDPNKELPARSVETLLSFFDINIIPINDATDKKAIVMLQKRALTLAEDETRNVQECINKIAEEETAGLTELTEILQNALGSKKKNDSLNKLWVAEIDRRKQLVATDVSAVINPPHYKKNVLRSLFLSDEQFIEVINTSDPRKYSSELFDQLKKTRLADSHISIVGEVLNLDLSFRRFIHDPLATYLRDLCKIYLQQDYAMKFFFDDIRDSYRRQRMVNVFLEDYKHGWQSIRRALSETLQSGVYEGIHHQRNWLFELLLLTLNIGLKDFGRQMYLIGSNVLALQDPAGHFALRSERFMASNHAHSSYVDDVIVVAKAITKSTPERVDTGNLVDKLLDYRIGAAIKLQKLNPLYMAVQKLCTDLQLEISYESHHSLLSDMLGTNNPVGKNFLFKISDRKAEVLLNAIYIGDGYGSDHKADEWSARRVSLGYRYIDESPIPLQRAGYVFLIDGDWNEKSIRKLYSAGWTHVISLPELEGTLRSVFKI